MWQGRCQSLLACGDGKGSGLEPYPLSLFPFDSLCSDAPGKCYPAPVFARKDRAGMIGQQQLYFLSFVEKGMNTILCARVLATRFK